MFQVAAISVATEPVTRIRSANLRDPTQGTQTPPESSDTASQSVFEDPAAVVHIGAQARALARREASQRDSQVPEQPKASDNGPLAEAARSAAQARAVASVERKDGEKTRAARGSTNPLADAASSAAKALWGDEASDEEDDANAVADSPPDLVQPAPSQPDDVELSAAEERKVEEMQKRDREVRQQEQSAASSGAQFTGPVHYEYRMGPDGKLYAVDGSAPIDVQPVQGDPVATLRKMEAVERAARAPAEPSLADHQVAAQAARLAQRARAELAATRYGETRDSIEVREREVTPQAESDDGTQPGAEGTSRDADRAPQRVEDVLASAARSVESTFSDVAGAEPTLADAARSEAPVDLEALERGATPPALRSYEALQRPSGFSGAGFQLVA